MYLASSYWRGALNIGDMRMFNTEEEAWNYVLSLPRVRILYREESRVLPSYARIYLLSATEPPKRISRRPEGTNAGS